MTDTDEGSNVGEGFRGAESSGEAEGAGRAREDSGITGMMTQLGLGLDLLKSKVYRGVIILGPRGFLEPSVLTLALTRTT